MQSINDLLYNFAIFIKRYPIVYFSIAGLILLSMIIYLYQETDLKKKEPSRKLKHYC